MKLHEYADLVQLSRDDYRRMYRLCKYDDDRQNTPSFCAEGSYIAATTPPSGPVCTTTGYNDVYATTGYKCIDFLSSWNTYWFELHPDGTVESEIELSAKREVIHYIRELRSCASGIKLNGPDPKDSM